jgi:TolB protein
MRRAETFWQGVVLLLVLLMTVGIYLMLGLVLKRLHGGRQAAVTSAPTQSVGAVQVLEPLDGSLLQKSASLPVRAAIVEPGFVRAELQVDGLGVSAQANLDPQAVPWTVEWAWEEVGEGGHVLTVQARGLESRLETSEPVVVTVVPAGKLVFSSNRDGAYALYAMQTDGRMPTRLTTGPGDARQPALRKGGVLAYVAESETAQAMIRQVDAEGSNKRQDLVVGRDPAWAPDGAQLSYAASSEGVSQVFTLEANRGTPFPVTAEEAYAGQPAWSPDGTRLAYVAVREGNWDIWVAAPDGGEPRRLTDDQAMDWAPDWAPDGSRLAFVSDRGGIPQVYVMRADGTDVQPLTDLSRGAESPCWSPDGFWLAFVAYTGDGTGIKAREIYLMQADGSNQVRLTRNAFDDTEPDWPPQVQGDADATD